MTNDEYENARYLKDRISVLKGAVEWYDLHGTFRNCLSLVTQETENAIAELAVKDVRDQIESAEKEFSSL